MSTDNQQFDTLIKSAKVFNNGELAVVEDIAISDGRIVKRAQNIDESHAKNVVDANGLWAMPGLFDIHTHYDLELEVAPGLPESTRHGTTSVVISNCSLGLAFGAQRVDGTDPIVDCYARVENIPKQVLRACGDKVDWDNPKAYLNHLDNLKLGPNVITMVPHSMLRIEIMGFEASVSRDPTESELSQMQSVLRDALKDGYVGFSTDALPFHYLANQPNTHKTIPTQFAKYKEIKTLTQVVREEGALWQATPPKDNTVDIIKTFMLTSGRLHGKALKTTVVAALDIANNGSVVRLAKLLARILNSKLIQGRFYLQALGAPFKVWSDGAITPLAEEIPELRQLNETDLEDREGRLKILNNPEYIKIFKAMWLKGKTGWNIARLKRWLNREDYAFNRTLSDMLIDKCPLEAWEGQSFQTVFKRTLDIKTGKRLDEANDQERALIASDFFWIVDEADFVLQVLRSFDTEISWSTVTANRNMQTVRELLMNPLLLPGFNDCGAHLTNMAFYDVNLRSLKLAAQGGEKDVSYMVKRLTKDAADVFGVEGGTISEGDVADLILVDPEQLKLYDGEANIKRIYRDEFQHEQLVNRSDNVVPLVMIGGEAVWKNNEFNESIGQKKFGRLLRSINSLQTQKQNAA